ncbi:MAG: GNAT family N-acetyltransferase [Flavobacterium sp.]|nr:GNAT family N-acetyltransferase [Flavobacterium sp.]
MLNINFTPFPILETERLLLRCLNNDDINDVFALRSNPETMKFIPRPLLTNNDEALAHIKMINDKIDADEGINWAICLKNSSKFVGLLVLFKIYQENFRAEIGYMILPKYNNQGIVTESIREVVNYGFDIINLHSIEAIIDPENNASERVLLKNGFIKEAHILENEFAEGKFWDTVIYSLLKRNRLR